MYPVSSHYLKLFQSSYILCQTLHLSQSFCTFSSCERTISKDCPIRSFNVFCNFSSTIAACHPIVFPYFSPKLPVACPLLQIFPLHFITGQQVFMQSILHITDRIIQGLIQFVTKFANIFPSSSRFSFISSRSNPSRRSVCRRLF